MQVNRLYNKLGCEVYGNAFKTELQSLENGKKTKTTKEKVVVSPDKEVVSPNKKSETIKEIIESDDKNLGSDDEQKKRPKFVNKRGNF
jgi:hypothetical protein